MIIQPFEAVRKGDLAITYGGDTFKILNKGTLEKMYRIYGKYQTFSLEEVTYDEFQMDTLVVVLADEDPIIYHYDPDGAYCKYHLKPPPPEKIYRERWFLLFQFGKDFHWKQDNEIPGLFTNLSPYNDWDLYKEKHIKGEFDDFVRECEFEREEGKVYYLYYVEVDYERLHDIEDLFDHKRALDKIEIEEVMDWISKMKPIRVN